MTQSHRGRIILVRHGETEANLRRCFAESDDVPLTDVGRLQAHELAQRLAREFQPETLVSSPFVRARQTSEIIGRVLGLETETIQGIQERDFGVLKGHPYERLGESMFGDGAGDPASQVWTWRPAGGESLDDVRRRSIHAIESLRDRYSGREMVIVSHGAVIQAVCAHITGDWGKAFVPPNCGVVTLNYDAQGWALPALSEASGAWDEIAKPI